MFKCYESELISSENIIEENIKLSEVCESHKEGEVFRYIHSRMPFAVRFRFKFSKNFIRKILLVLMPIFVVKIKTNKYACVGNVRSLHFARNSMIEKHNKIPVQVIGGNKDLIRHMALIDVVVGPLLFTVGKKRMDERENIELKINRLEGIKITKGYKTTLADSNIKVPVRDKLSLIPAYKNSVNGIFTIDCIRLLVLMYPIYVAVLNKKEEELVGNSFVLKICCESLLDNKKTPCNKISNLDNSKIKILSDLNAMLPVYAFSLGVNGFSYIGEAIDKMSKRDNGWVFLKKMTNFELSNFSGCSTISLRKRIVGTVSVDVKGKQLEDLEKYNIKADDIKCGVDK